MMDKATFDARYKKIQEDTRLTIRQSLSKRDQLVSRLFVDSEWTQQKIADHLGKTNQWVSLRLRFGRFCNFLPTAVGKKLPVNLSEWRFRDLWSQVTSGDRVPANAPAETRMFEAILETDEWVFQLADAVPYPTNDMLKQHAVGRKWMSADEIADVLTAESDIPSPDDLEDRVKNALGKIKNSNAGGLLLQEKPFAGGVAKYKLTRVRNPDGYRKRAIELAAEEMPILEQIHKWLQLNNTTDVVGLIKPEFKRLNDLVKRYM